MGPEAMSALAQDLLALAELVAALRSENGCPWDRKQTPETMRVYLLEEMHELVEAVDASDAGGVREELGDVLFQVFFLSRIFEERGAFDLSGVARRVTEKMKARHPHVFGDVRVADAEEVRRRWHEFKAKEPAQKPQAGPFDSIPKSLPALMRAYRVCERATRVGFPLPGEGDGRSLGPLWDAFLQKAQAGDGQGAAQALGDFLFFVACAARGMDVHPETALAAAVERFVRENQKGGAHG